MTPAEILDKATDVIDERGHCHGAFQKAHGVCIYGAINFIVNGDANKCSLATKDAEDAMRLADVWAIGYWNDTHTAAEVTSTLRAVAATLRAQRETRNNVEPLETEAVNRPLETHTA